MKPDTPEQEIARKARISELAKAHGLSSDGYHVIVGYGLPYETRIDMSASDLDRFVPALLHHAHQAWAPAA